MNNVKMIWLAAATVVPFTTVLAQNIAVNAGLGLEYFQTPSLFQYLSGYAAPGSVTPGTFTTTVQFVVGGKYFFLDDWALGVEYGYIVKDYSGVYGPVDCSYSMPSLTLTRLLPGDGYYWSIGGAIGYHFAYVNQTLGNANQTQNFSAHGLGVKVDAGIETKLGDTFYVRVAADVRGEFIGNFRSQDGTTLEINPGTSTERTINGYLSGVGLTFQLVYYF